MNPPHRGLTCWALAAALILVLAAMAAARAPAAAAATCPPPPTSIAGLLKMESHSSGRLNPFRPVACYGNRTLSLHGYVAATTGLGGTTNVVVTPVWLGDPWKFIAYALQPTSAHDPADARYGAGPYFFVKSSTGWDPHPLARYVDRWVIVQGHFDDPAARRCHVTKVFLGSPPARAQVVRECREVFVLTAVAPAGATPPATDAAPRASSTSTGDRSPRVLAILGGTSLGIALIALRRRGARRAS